MPAARAQTLRASVRSRPETLVACLSRWCKLACGNYTLSPIMSIGPHQIVAGPVAEDPAGRRVVEERGIELAEEVLAGVHGEGRVQIAPPPVLVVLRQV